MTHLFLLYKIVVDTYMYYYFLIIGTFFKDLAAQNL
jgi:hypothetical protein